jgi:hypothetical protein
MESRDNKSVVRRTRERGITVDYISLTNNKELVYQTLMSHFKEELNTTIYAGQTTLLSCLIAEAFSYAVEKRNLDINNMPLKAMLRAAIDYIARGLPPDNLSPLVDVTILKYREIAYPSLIPKTT